MFKPKQTTLTKGFFEFNPSNASIPTVVGIQTNALPRCKGTTQRGVDIDVFITSSPENEKRFGSDTGATVLV